MNQIVQSPLPLDVNVQLGEALNVTVVDRRQESIAFFNHFNAFQRGQIAAEVMPIAAHRQRRGPDRTAEIEGEDLSAGIAAELQGHQRQ